MEASGFGKAKITAQVLALDKDLNAVGSWALLSAKCERMADTRVARFNVHFNMPNDPRYTGPCQVQINCTGILPISGVQQIESISTRKVLYRPPIVQHDCTDICWDRTSKQPDGINDHEALCMIPISNKPSKEEDPTEHAEMIKRFPASGGLKCSFFEFVPKPQPPPPTAFILRPPLPLQSGVEISPEMVPRNPLQDDDDEDDEEDDEDVHYRSSTAKGAPHSEDEPSASKFRRIEVASLSSPPPSKTNCTACFITGKSIEDIPLSGTIVGDVSKNPAVVVYCEFDYPEQTESMKKDNVPTDSCGVDA